MSEFTRRSVLRATAIAVAAGSGRAWLRPPAVASAAADRTIALTGVTVIDVTGRPARPDMTVVIRRQQIAAVGRSDDVMIPAEATVLHLAGKYVIPGLCDMHVHSIESERVTPPVYLANGITTAGYSEPWLLWIVVA